MYLYIPVCKVMKNKPANKHSNLLLSGSSPFPNINLQYLSAFLDERILKSYQQIDTKPHMHSLCT